MNNPCRHPYGWNPCDYSRGNFRNSKFSLRFEKYLVCPNCMCHRKDGDVELIPWKIIHNREAVHPDRGHEMEQISYAD